MISSRMVVLISDFLYGILPLTSLRYLTRHNALKGYFHARVLATEVDELR